MTSAWARKADAMQDAETIKNLPKFHIDNI
jgi:hypothetical protein